MGVGDSRKTNIEGEGVWTVCRFKGGGGLAGKKGVFLSRGSYPNVHYDNEGVEVLVAQKWIDKVIQVVRNSTR